MGIETLAIASIGSSILGGVTSAVGSFMGGQSAAAAHNYRAQVARNQAQYARQVGIREAEAQQMRTASVLGQQQAAQAASGLDTQFGSALDVRASTAQMGKLDELTILNNAALKAWGLEEEAKLDKFRAKQARTSSYLDVGKSLLGSVSSVSDKWFAFQQAGIRNPMPFQPGAFG